MIGIGLAHATEPNLVFLTGGKYPRKFNSVFAGRFVGHNFLSVTTPSDGLVTWLA